MKNITGNKYGLLTVVERVGKIGAVQLIKCRCNCGNETIVRYPNLTSGITTSCGCVKRSKTSQRRFKDIAGQTFGELTVIKRFSNIGDKKIKWLCKCSCGSICVVTGSNLKSGNSTSCGCLRASINESIIINELREKHVLFQKEVKFDDLKAPTGRPLRFDFQIFTEDSFFLLEYQGEQHFHPDGWSHIGRTQRQYTDTMKKEYCKTNDIELVTISYDEDTVNKLYNILENHKVLYDNTVPSSKEKV